MSRAKQNIDDTVSLFPFLSILACVIGILVLMITAITLSQIGKENESPSADAAEDQRAAEEAKERAEQYKTWRTQMTADTLALRDLEQRGRKLEAARQDEAVRAANIAQAKTERANLEAQIQARRERLVQSKAERELQTKQLARLEPENAQLDEKLQQLRLELKKLQAALAQRTEPPSEAQVTIQPSGSGADEQAQFVECAANSIVLHQSQPPLRIPAAKIEGHAEYLALLEKVKQSPKGTIIFLIRPDGVNTYNAARNVARGRYITNGKLAIAGQGQLDLSLFGK